MTNEEASGKVSIIMPTLGLACIWCALTHLALTTARNVELIIVADKPHPKMMSMFSRFNAIALVNNEQVGVPHAMNQGIRMATRPYILLTNDDIMPMTAGWLTPMVEALEKHPEFGMVSPRVIRPWSEDKAWYGSLGEGSLLTREMIDKVGLFDESPIYAHLGTDGDYYARCMEKGYDFHGIPTSMIAHNSGRTVGAELSTDYCDEVAEYLKDRYGDLPDQHLLPVYEGEGK